MRKEIALDRSNVPGWMEDMTDYRVIVRVDGQGTWDKPITPKTEQRSHGQWLWKRDDLLRFEPSLSLSNT